MICGVDQKSVIYSFNVYSWFLSLKGTLSFVLQLRCCLTKGKCIMKSFQFSKTLENRWYQRDLNGKELKWDETMNNNYSRKMLMKMKHISLGLFLISRCVRFWTSRLWAVWLPRWQPSTGRVWIQSSTQTSLASSSIMCKLF